MLPQYRNPEDAESAVPHELPRDAERDTTTARATKMTEPGCTLDELLQVVTACDRFAWLPEPSRHVRLLKRAASISHRATSPGRGVVSSSDDDTSGARMPRFAKAAASGFGSLTRRSTSDGLPHSARSVARASTAVGMVLEVGEVDDRVTRQLARRVHDRLWRKRRPEVSRQRQRAHRRMLIEIGVRVERDHLEAGSRGRLRRRTRRHPDDQDVHVATRFQVADERLGVIT